MAGTLTVYYTSDIHGCFSCLGGQPGLSSLAGTIPSDGNTLYLDGGDILQGSPFSYFLAQSGQEIAKVTARLMNLAGCRYVTLGNHDFSYGKDVLEAYLSALNATCLCANAHGVKGVERLRLVTLENGLRVGLTGVITPFVPQWEKAENLAGVTFTDPVAAACEALGELRAQGAEVTVCLCHMGFENDPVTGAPLSSSGENRAYEIAASLGFSLVLAGHTHAAFAGGMISNTLACSTADKATQYIRAEIGKEGPVFCALLPMGCSSAPEAAAFLAPYEKACEAFLSRPIGRLRAPIEKKPFLESALHGDAYVNLINAVQRERTGANISCASLQNTPVGLSECFSAGEVIRAYPFPNTLCVLEVDRAVLKQALERSASFLTLGADGQPAIAACAFTPVQQFFNFDLFSGLHADVDLSRAEGDRVISIRYAGEELPAKRKLRLCLNSYRASGAGGYPFFKACKVLFTGQDEVQPLLLEYFGHSGTIVPDTESYIHFYNGRELL